MMSKEKIIGTFTVSSLNKIDLFRIHLFEKSIRFDEHFAQGLIRNEKILKKLLKISNRWSKGELEDKETFFLILNALKNYENYLSDFYFLEEELDKKGRYIEPFPLHTLNNNLTKKETSEHYEYLKKTNKLKPISKKEFEKNIIYEDVSDFYISNYPKKNAKFYTYTTIINEEEEEEVCYLLVVNDKVLLGF